MKKAIIVEYSFMTRIVIDEENENLQTVVSETKQKILDKVSNELEENLCECTMMKKCLMIPKMSEASITDHKLNPEDY